MPQEFRWPPKVQRYGITCPHQRSLIARYENKIDWNGGKIESPQALNQHLQEVLLPQLKQCISPDDPRSHYCNSLQLERILQNPAPHIEEARKIHRSKGPEAAKTFLLDRINQHKKEHFDRWWSYLTQENALYKEHPAFQYLVLRPVLESSTAKDTRSPIPVDAEALAHLFERIDKGQVAPQRRVLSLLCELMAFGGVSQEEPHRFGSDCHWVVIKNSDCNAAERVAALSQRSGWCVASSSMARLYLNRSDFHLLVEAGRAVVALRFSRNSVVEVQGKGNRDPGPWWPRVLLYTAARAVLMQDRSVEAASQTEAIRRKLKDAQQDVERLRTVLKDQPAKVQFLNCEWVAALGQAEMGQDNPHRLIVREAWEASLNADPLCAGMAPAWMQQDPDFKRILRGAWFSAVKADPLNARSLPAELFGDQELLPIIRTGWIEHLKSNPSFFHHCPEILRADPAIVEVLRPYLLEQLKLDPKSWKQCTKNLQADPILRSAWITQLTSTHNAFQSYSEILQSDPPLLQALANTLRLNPRLRTDCPEQPRVNPEIVKALVQWRLALSKRSQPNPPDNDKKAKLHLLPTIGLNVTGVRKDQVLDFLLLTTPPLPRYSAESFDVLVTDPNATRNTLQLRRHSPQAGWANCSNALAALKNAPWHFHSLPQPHQLHPLIRAAASEGWAKFVSDDPRCADFVPDSLSSHPTVESVIRQATQDTRESEATLLENKCMTAIRKNPSMTDAEISALGLPDTSTKIWKKLKPARLKHWKQRVRDDWRKWMDTPESLRQEESLLRVMHKAVGPKIRKDTTLWEKLPDAYRQDPCLQRVHHFATLKEG